ncbi:hypothetical protein KRX52_06700 [Pseudomonas sp. MAP12]|uniref:Cytochrome c domain-containing protein n=1 Tax=Geopseudomonas aromaticivorans TaxID=2849492 RepID=A0ABS6MUL6_9GAMM|nr:hypothetical protein [Pseudomonas aromaticivorans]MBV2132492.1 hypothetical protein [Pseudomonas aromaticivorans]
MNAMGRGLLALLALGLPCASLHAAEEVSFSKAVAPIFRVQCATCHMNGDEPGGMKLYPSAAYQSLVGVASAGSPLQRVAPGAPEQSYLLHKLQGTHLNVGGAGVQMPFGQPPLAEDSLQLIRLWVEQGAKNN